MKIERLRLSGFKSFVDNTDFLVEHGLTGIVGPNGCGKSNILESLRWVMGATSAKALRGKGMEDVIFAGTSGRPARNMAEVTLWLNNSDRTAPSIFNDSDELEVIRRIERDAGSAYKINGKDVRQRDVQLLFADASTGANSPALVRQGQISELINAKPENRRKLLEEAAGISGLHTRRHEAELRLNAAETNLTRVEDVEQQLEDQLSSLKKQARQATRYKNLSGHIRRAEALGLYLRWTQAIETVTDSQAKASDIELVVETRTKETTQASAAQAEAASKLPPLREDEARAAAAVQRLNVERDNLDREEERAKAQADILTSRLTQIGQDIEREDLLISDAQGMLSRLVEEREGLDSKQASQQEELHAAETVSREAQNRLTEAEGQLDDLTQRSASLNAQHGNLKASLTDSQTRQETLQRELEETRQERQTLLDNAQDLSRNAELAAAINIAQTDANTAEDMAREADAARLAAVQDEKAARAPLQEAERELNKLKGEAKALSSVLKVNEASLWPPVIDALSVAPGYETALGAAFGDDLDAPTDEAAPVHWNELDGDARGSQALPEGVTCLGDYVQGPAQLKRRLNQVGLVSSRDDGNRLSRELAVGQRLVTREGDLWRWDGLTASADAETAAATRLAQRNRLTELDQDIESRSQRVAHLQETFESAARRASEKTEAEERARTAWRAAQVALSEARDQHSALDKANAETKARLVALDEAEKRIENDLAALTMRIDSIRSDITALPDMAVLEAKVAEQKASVVDLRTQLSEAQASLEGQRREAAIRAERLASIGKEHAEWTSRIENAAGHIEDLNGRRTATSAELEDVQKIPAEIEGKRHILLDKIGEAEGKRSIAADALALAESALKGCDDVLRERQEHLSGAREERARIDALLQGAKQRVDEVRDRIRETLDCAPEDLFEKAELKEGENLPSLEQIDTKLERLKRERENMGAVNLRAEEEATEIRERLEELQTERGELEEAINKLRRSISDLNREGRERLLQAFESVNTEFSRLFTVLFEGGEAHLRLTESDDPLSAGLEIFARPPGKRMQNMSLMSGGEQALTATALIFAVFLANPAPICFLDEVDAPLDDANIERFCDLLDEMINSTDTKFVVITHHALTMSRMNRLYGVTMAERGISQLVSVDLTAVEDLRAAG